MTSSEGAGRRTNVRSLEGRRSGILAAVDRVIKTRLDSSSIASIAYAPDEELLEVQFRRTGHYYDYFGVPEESPTLLRGRRPRPGASPASPTGAAGARRGSSGRPASDAGAAPPYQALMESDSKGAFVNQVIKPNFDNIRVDFPMG